EVRSSPTAQAEAIHASLQKLLLRIDPQPPIPNPIPLHLARVPSNLDEARSATGSGFKLDQILSNESVAVLRPPSGVEGPRQPLFGENDRAQLCPAGNRLGNPESAEGTDLGVSCGARRSRIARACRQASSQKETASEDCSHRCSLTLAFGYFFACPRA